MKNYDYIIVGNGSGGALADAAVSHNLKIAVIDKKPIGGTCENFGCIPSKMLMLPAHRIMEIKEAARLGIKTEITDTNFSEVMERMRIHRKATQDRRYDAVRNSPPMDFYFGEAEFTDEYTLSINGKTLRGEKIVIAAGARPSHPPIEGIDSHPTLNNETVLELKRLPRSMIIIGGGYIAAEYGHFFSAFGSEVTIIEQGNRLLSNEEPEISEALEKALGDRLNIVLNVKAEKMEGNDYGLRISGRDEKGDLMKIEAEELLIATGRISNADVLKVGNTGVAVDDRGFIRVNERLETGKEGIWALGDIIGKQMFKHVANREAGVVFENSIHGEKMEMDYDSIPHAVFTYPEIASLGYTENQARKKHDIWVGRAGYSDTAWGLAMREEEGFVKIIVDRESRNVIGAHIFGPNASMIIQELINAASGKHDISALANPMHIHPALPEVITSALYNLEEV